MRNLKLLESRAVKSTSNEISSTLLLAYSSDNNVVYTATSSNLTGFRPDTGELLSFISLKEETEDALEDSDCVPVSLQHVSDQQAVCVAMSDGRICFWQTETHEEMECVGVVDGGITAMSWSPDFEVVVITTGQKKLILMTRYFDVITEVSMSPEGKGEDSQVSVGWGKKETQFHGSAGKQAAKSEQVLVQSAGERDDGKPRISWRGDGQFFVISAIDPETCGRFLNVWSRECTFQGRSEPVDGLQHCVCWKPSGSLITSVQTKRHTNTQDVVFYERNGLRHGEFTLPPINGTDFQVMSILWNQDSMVLALWLDEIDLDGATSKSHLQLWTVNNYHWYLKQSFLFEGHIASVIWDDEHAYKMHVVTRDGLYHVYTWAWTTDHTLGSCESDLSLVAVINGAQVLVTPMRCMVVPPPMAAFTLQLPFPVNSLTFDPSPSSNGLAVQMSNGQIAVYKYSNAQNEVSHEDLKTADAKIDAAGGDGFRPQCDLLLLEGIYQLENGLKNINHFLWLTKNEVLFCVVSQSASVLYLGEFSLETKTIVTKKSYPVQSYVRGVALDHATGETAVQLNTGALYRFSKESGLLPWLTKNGEAVCFSYPCTEMAVATIGGESAVLGLTERFRFFVNDLEVASNCTSFGIHNDFLLLTTLSHTLRCISLSTKVTELPKLSDGKAHPFDESIRRVERGSRIVTVVANGTKLVLQMPRGNLETVHPRALVLMSLKHLLNSGKIMEAFLIMRKHRINLNLLHDHNPTYYLQNIEEIIKQIDNPSYFNVFLTELVDDDVTLTMYTASYPQEPSIAKAGGNKTVSKVDKICDALLAAFKKFGQDRYLQSILTAHVKKTQPELEEALLLVWSLHEQSAKSAEEALKYLLFLVDVNALYNVALGTYNFDLVMMVAEKSQKDPKEYVPFLNQLRRMEQNYRCYTIDKHLKKFSKALECIAKCGEEHFEECINLVSDHKLHARALRIFNPGSSQYKTIAALYGNYLKTKNRHDEAGIMFIKAQQWEEALEAFRAAHDWRQVFCMASKLDYSGNRMSELAVKIAGELKSHQRHTEAARVLEEYAQDIEEAVVALIEGSQWEEALRLMHRYKRLDLIETHLREALEENYDHHIEMLTSQREQYDRYRTRLAMVRIQKMKAKAELLEGLAEHNDAEADLISDTTSMTGVSVHSQITANSSRSTVFTKNTGSSRTRRKAENKKWSLKEGSANEEFALVDALAKIIKAVDGLKDETSSLLKMLIQFNFDEKACSLQAQYSDFLNLIQASVSEIWVYNQDTQTDMNLGPHSTAHAIAKAMQKGQRLHVDEAKLDPVLLVPPALNKDCRWKLHIATDKNE